MSSCAPAPVTEADLPATIGLPMELIIESTEPAFEPSELSDQPQAGLAATSTSASSAGAAICDAAPDGVLVETPISDQAGISLEADMAIPPAPPAKVEFRTDEGGALVSWQGTGTDVDHFYKIYRQAVTGDCWQLIGVVLVEGDNKGTYQFNAPDHVAGDSHAFAVATVDIYRKESGLSLGVETRADS